MRTISADQAKKISGNVLGNNNIGTVDVVLYNAKKAGLSEVVISRDGAPATDDNVFFGDDKYVTVKLD